MYQFDKDIIPFHWDIESWRNLSANSILFCIFDSNIRTKILGCALTLIIKEEKLIHLLKIGIDPTIRRQKLGFGLLEQISNYGQMNAIEKIYLEVASKNSNAIEFYQRANYKIISNKKKYYSDGGDAQVMLKILES